MCELRKVVFRLDDTEYGLFDLNDEERKEVEELQNPQEGYFHGWEETIVTDPKTGIDLKRLVAVVEDANGVIHKVNSELIKFIPVS